MLIEYVHLVLKKARYEVLESGAYYGAIPDFPGVWSEADDLETCRNELREVLEDWIVLSLKRGDRLPPIDSIDLNLVGHA